MNAVATRRPATPTVGPAMDELQQLLIEAACQRLIVDYTHALDRSDWDAFVELFTEDALWQRPNLEPLVGHEAIRHWSREWPKDILMRHVAGNIQVTVIDADHARGLSSATVYRQTGHRGGIAPLKGPVGVVDYRDTFRRTVCGWRFASRTYQFVFQAG